MIGTDAFQECDTVGITSMYETKLACTSSDIAKTMHEAFYVAKAGRPCYSCGYSKDIQFMDAKYTAPIERPSKYVPKVKADMQKIQEMIDLLATAKKPGTYTGGVNLVTATALLREFSRMLIFQ